MLDVAAMRDADAKAVEREGQTQLIARAGVAVAHEAQRLLGHLYGRRVAVLVGPGLNGADGRVAGDWLRNRGAHVTFHEVAFQPSHLDAVDLVIDAAFGIGCSRPYAAPTVAPGIPVLAVDLPSGVDADTGDVLGSPLAATVTVALGAIKPAHVTGRAAIVVGELRFAGLSIVEHALHGVVEDADLTALDQLAPARHKWSHPVHVLAGSATMPGAAALVTQGARAAGASMIRLSSRNVSTLGQFMAPEVVFDLAARPDARSRCIVAGPGLGTGAGSWLRPRLTGVTVPVVLDADALRPSVVALAPHGGPSWVLTPHDGEFARLTGHDVGLNRLAAVRRLAASSRCVVLLKGPTTIVANPAGVVRIVRSGTPALATAGSGDVLAGIIGALIARGVAPFEAAALGAHLHGLAGQRLVGFAGASALAGALTTLVAERARR